jgi:phosphate transport system protein
MSREHTVKAYTEELDLLKSKVLEMGKECETQLTKAVDSLITIDARLAHEIIEGDTKINELQGRVDDLAVRMLALRQPMAMDLRNIVAAQKIAADFERIADYAANIAKYVVDLDKPILESPVKSIVQMIDSALRMLSNVLVAYQLLDREKAREVWHQDKQIDKIYFGLLTKLRTLMIEDSAKINASTRLLFVGRCCERIGDHIMNVAESVHFIVSGEMHHGSPMR